MRKKARIKVLAFLLERAPSQGLVEDVTADNNQVFALARYRRGKPAFRGDETLPFVVVRFIAPGWPAADRARDQNERRRRGESRSYKG